MAKPQGAPVGFLETLAGLVDQLNSAVIICDADSTVVLFNTEAARILNVEREQILGHSLVQLPAQVRGPLTPLCRVLRDTLEAGEQYHRQTLLLSEEYTPAILGYTTSVVYDSADELAGAVLLFADLSEESARLQDGQHSEQLAQMTRLASFIAHEVKNPMATIQLYADSLKDHADPLVASSAEAIANEISLCRSRLDAIRSGLVPGAGAEALTPYCDLNRVAVRVGEREGLWRQGGLLVQASGAPCFVPVDYKSAESLMSNLIGYLAGGAGTPGPVRVTVQCAEKTVVVDLEAENVRHADMRQYVSELENGSLSPVWDTSAPPPPGLGLWLAKRIATRGGGAVTLEQRPNLARIRVGLPHLAGHWLVDKRVLVVDDEPNLRNVIVRTLTAQGADVQQAGNGREALLATRVATPDAVVSDTLMPVMDGFEMLKALPASLPVLMISGTGDSLDRARQYSRKGLAFLAKPFSSEEFIVALAYLMWEAGR